MTKMHEGRTDFDALADLFLGDGVLSATGTTGPKSATTSSTSNGLLHAELAAPSSSTQTSAPTLRLTLASDRFEQAERQNDRPSNAASESSNAACAAAPVAASSVPIEALLVGHLPVMGGVWVTQYAKHVADREHCVVALLRLQAGQVSIDVFTPRSASVPTSSRIGEMHTSGLMEAIRSARSRCGLWLVRVDEASEADLVSAPHVSRMTLLTGADDPAVVASYRTIKSLQQAEEGCEQPLRLSIAIMGADDAKAEAAETKLQRAASNFLGRSLASAARIAKIGACTTTTLFRGEANEDTNIVSLIALLRGAPIPSESAATATEPDALPPTSHIEPKPDPKPQPSQHADGVTSGASTPHASRTPTIAQQSISSDNHAASLAAHIAGLRPLSFRCPYAPNVELALGSSGVLHLVSPMQQGGPGALLTVAAWAQSHASLLEAARPEELNMAHPEGPVLHVVTSDAKVARPMLDTGVRVHLMLKVGESVTVHDLN
jgi:hypothetical protein